MCWFREIAYLLRDAEKSLFGKLQIITAFAQNALEKVVIWGRTQKNSSERREKRASLDWKCVHYGPARNYKTRKNSCHFDNWIEDGQKPYWDGILIPIWEVVQENWFKTINISVKLNSPRESPNILAMLWGSWGEVFSELFLGYPFARMNRRIEDTVGAFWREQISAKNFSYKFMLWLDNNFHKLWLAAPRRKLKNTNFQQKKSLSCKDLIQFGKTIRINSYSRWLMLVAILQVRYRVCPLSSARFPFRFRRYSFEFWDFHLSEIIKDLSNMKYQISFAGDVESCRLKSEISICISHTVAFLREFSKS